MFGSEGKGSIDGSFLRSGEIFAYAGEEKLVSLGIDSSGVFWVTDGKFYL